MTDDFTDEELMAYADGELAPDRASSLAAALPARPDLAERVALFAGTRSVAAESVRSRLSEPVPAQLKASVEEMIRRASEKPASATVTSLRPRQAAPRSSPFANWAMPIAASFLALATGVLGYWLASGGAPSPAYYQIAGSADPELSRILSKLPSGETAKLEASGAEVAMVASFHRGDQALCREFTIAHAEIGDQLSVACRSAGQWTIDLALRTGGGSTDAYKPASSAETVDAFLNALGAGPAIVGEAETDALDKTQ
ncbi:hypothetical protein G5V57_17205 [Nordella sp. HKS 07]|uniref:anti-sigma factor family protein n=1 Tax=Nordella sp. HKS 07 TaxID=2712222 RepID=UPI0013E0FBB4|nr:hypothetical protein [Nordella sp. HKS 07]QIG49305.1 hypothetical protein G5V57_17205 [Nordella sp. HKS 07]